MKKIISLAIALLSLSIFCLSPFAEGTQSAMGNSPGRAYGVDIPGSGEPGTFGVSRVLAECNGGPHDMLAHGWVISTMWIREKQLSATVPAPSVQSAIS